MGGPNGQVRAGGLVGRVTCPHCWEHYSPEKSLWVSEHQDMLGDPRLGPEHAQRFLPTRFTVSGEAIDAKGFSCHQLACPNCHLTVPRPFLEMEPLFLSIFGAPASGKSYFLAAMTWELRKMLPLNFAVSFADADPSLNRILNEYEESLFSSSEPDELVPLAKLIRKTEEQGELYDMVSFGTQTVSYPRPFVFSMQPQEGHPNAANSASFGRVVCLYDNAGESFQPGKDSAANPVTRHLAQSRVLLYVFDPTQDARFRKHCDEKLGPASAARISRQEPILQEAAARIRRYASLKQTEKHARPLVVILTKSDAWSHLLGEDLPPEPWKLMPAGQVGTQMMARPFHAFDAPAVERRSQLARTLLLKLCPEIVNAAEGFATRVVYVPVSAVGWETSLNDRNGLLSIRPEDTRPHWVTAPYLYALYRANPGLIPSLAIRKPTPPTSRSG